MKNVRIGIVGLGTVGSGVVRILKEEQKLIAQQTGLTFEIVKAIIANPDRKRAAYLQDVALGTDIDQLLDDKSVDIIVEVMGSVNEAKTLIERALTVHKHVVTANKDLIAQYGDELAELATKNEVALRYEASVAGGIPILQILRTAYKADQVHTIAGILNGTTNFILTQMDEQGLTYDQALKAAKEKGFAESDPTNDVDGFDAAYKLAILTKMAFGISVPQSDIAITGIRELAIDDVKAAQAAGYELKLIGLSDLTAEGIRLAVAPMVVHKNQPIAQIRNEHNAVLVKSQNIGTALYVGPGAGQLPTGNSVVADLIHVGQTITSNGEVYPFALKVAETQPKRVSGNRSYWVLVATDDPDSLAENIKLSFAGAQISNEMTIRGFDPHQAWTSLEVTAASLVAEAHFTNTMQRLADVKAIYPVLEA